MYIYLLLLAYIKRFIVRFRNVVILLPSLSNLFAVYEGIYIYAALGCVLSKNKLHTQQLIKHLLTTKIAAD